MTTTPHRHRIDPVTGAPPEGFAGGVTAYPVQERPDGVYVTLPEHDASAYGTLTGRPAACLPIAGKTGPALRQVEQDPELL